MRVDGGETVVTAEVGGCVPGEDEVVMVVVWTGENRCGKEEE